MHIFSKNLSKISYVSVIYVLLWLLTGSPCGLVCSNRLEQQPHICSS